MTDEYGYERVRTHPARLIAFCVFAELMDRIGCNLNTPFAGPV